MAGIARFVLWLWGLSFLLQATVVFYLLGTGKWRIYRGLLFYLSANISQSIFLYSTYTVWGFSSPTAKRLAWISQIPVVTMRAWAVMDLCRLLLDRYTGVWSLAWRILALLGLALVLGSVLTAGLGWEHIVPNVNINLEWTTVLLLVALFVFARHYEIAASPALRAMALGFFLYSAFAILNDTVLSHWLTRYSPTWNVLAMLSFLASVCLWLYAVRKPLEDGGRVSLLPPDVYHQLTPDLNLRLRTLNERLSKLWNPEAHRP